MITSLQRSFLCFLSLCLVATNANAASSWQDTTNNHLWEDSSNWDNFPVASDSTFIRYNDIAAGGTGPIIEPGVQATARNLSLEVQGSDQAVSMAMTGGTLDLYFEAASNVYFRIGAGPGPGTALFDMTGGKVTVDVDPDLYNPGQNGYVRVGFGYPGSVTMSNDATIEAWDLLVDSEDGAVDLNDSARIVLKGDDVTTLQEYVEAGAITSNGGTAPPVLRYNPSTDLTTISVVPEPATSILVMLGISPLVLRRQR